MPPARPAPSRPTRRRTRVVMWLAMAAVVATVVVAVVVGSRAAALLLAGVVLLLALVRAVSPAPGPYGISIRSRAFDVTSLLVGGLVIGLLALLTQPEAF